MPKKAGRKFATVKAIRWAKAWVTLITTSVGTGKLDSNFSNNCGSVETERKQVCHLACSLNDIINK